MKGMGEKQAATGTTAGARSTQGRDAMKGLPILRAAALRMMGKMN